MSINIKSSTGSANATTTLTLTAPATNTTTANTRHILLHHITVSTKGADIAADIVVTITNAASETYIINMRSGQVYGVVENFDQPIVSRGTLTVTATAGGAGCISTIAAVYEVR